MHRSLLVLCVHVFMNVSGMRVLPHVKQIKAPQNNFHDSNGRISNQLTYILPSYLELHSVAANLTIYRSTSVLTHISCTFRYQFYIEICIWPVG